MAHFANIDNSNIVQAVIVVNNEVLLDNDGNESEELGVSFCQSLYGDETRWKQTSYNGNFRKNFAFTGYTYDEAMDAFIPISPYQSWVLNEETCQWQPPIPYPSDGQMYYWDEPSVSWSLVPETNETEQ